jgi:hypothetical protein
MSSRVRECPKCGQDISDSYQEYDPDVGMMCAGWVCDACDVFVEDDDEQDDRE